MQALATKIRAELPTLTEQYAQELAKMPDYAALPTEEHLAASKHDLELLSTCLEAGSAQKFLQYIRDKLAERLTEGFSLEVLIRVLTILEQTIAPLVEELATAKFLWATFSQAQVIVMQSIANQLQSSESQYQQLVSRSPVGIFRTTPEGEITNGNPAFLEIVGYDSLAAINELGVAALYADAKEREEFFARLQVGSVSGFETELRRPDEQLITVSITAQLIKDESGRQFIEGIVQDISERKKIAAELQESEKRFRSIVENSSMGIFVVDESYHFTYANERMAEITGYLVEEIVGMDFRQFLTEESRELVADRYARRQRGEDVRPRYEFTVIRKDGQILQVEITVAVIKDSEGRIRTIAQLLDISERKELEQQVQETLERRARQVRLSTEVSQEIAALTDLAALFERVVTLVKERFGYYHVQILRYVPERQAMELIAGYGQVGAEMLAADYSLPYGEGVVGTAAATGEPLLLSDVTEDASWKPHSQLPAAKGELAVPIQWRGELLGVLDVQSDIMGDLSADDQLLLVGLCGQIAVAIQNARLRQETEEHLQELEQLTQAMSHEGWESLWQASGEQGYLFDFVDLEPAEELWNEEIGWVAEHGEPARAISEEKPAAVSPLSIRGELQGVLGVYEDPEDPLTGDELELIDSVAQQVAEALEDARLFEESQRAQLTTAQLYNLSRDLNVAANTKELLQVLQRPAIEYGAVDLTLFYLEVDEEHNPTRLGVVENWHREDKEPLVMASGSDIDTIAELWMAKPEGVSFFSAAEQDSDLNPSARQLLQQWGFSSQVVLPLKQAERWLGFLTISWAEPHELSAEEQALYRSMITLVAPAVANFRLLEQTQAALEQVESTHRLYVREQWEELFSLQGMPFYQRASGEGELTHAEEFPPEVEQAMRSREVVLHAAEDGESCSSMIAPIKLRGEVIGALGLENEGREWSEDEQVLIRAVTDQLGLALENARLLEDSQRRAARERLIGEISSRLRMSSDVETVLQRTVQELGQVLGATGKIWMGGESDVQ